VVIVTELRKFADQRKLPPDDASQNETPVTTSLLVPAHDDQAGVLLRLIEPADAAANVAAGRVVTELTFDVPEPPAPVDVCNWT
jgi:hypothetical protein